MSGWDVADTDHDARFPACDIELRECHRHPLAGQMVTADLVGTIAYFAVYR